MTIAHINKISIELAVSPDKVRATAGLLSDGATVPFIARYRKEATGSLDEVAIAAIRDRLDQLEELDKRRDSILGSLTERGLLIGFSSRLRAAGKCYGPCAAFFCRCFIERLRGRVKGAVCAFDVGIHRWRAGNNQD